MKLRTALMVAVISCSSLLAQRPAPAPPQQNARQALLEMIGGGQKAIAKHLTVEVQQLLASAGAGREFVGMLGPFPSLAGSEAQTFETGPLLLSIKNVTEHGKIELRVENDDLSGDEDTLDLSLHVIRETPGEAEAWETFLSRFSVNMKMQAGVWRLNKIGVGLEFPVGDPGFLQKTILKELDQARGATAVASGTHVELKADTPPEIDFPPQQVVALLAIAESSFAKLHPDVGFTCSLIDLSEAASSMGLSQQVSSGVYKGYRLTLTGCQGRPTGSFQITAEPVQGNAGKAFCTDATQNVRVADDGRGSTCLAFGRMPAAPEGGDAIRFYQGLQESSTENAPVAPLIKDKN
jgi:hypothetical protein